eukprot:TRINITY_DN968_c0_g2_i1.p1 TRINITY_DN968_c0_g2~~TRINITY_DN968_c0_g2_i1.p1  ORF type:complete len:570 (-),score=58.56 TRINITY_DN968_c0_g2_i1:1326-3035(-)
MSLYVDNANGHHRHVVLDDALYLSCIVSSIPRSVLPIFRLVSSKFNTSIKNIQTHQQQRVNPSMTMQYLVEHDMHDILLLLHTYGCKWERPEGDDLVLCDLAAKHGSLSCLRAMRETGARMTYLAHVYAAQGGHLECLRYVYEHEHSRSSHVCLQAAYNGHLDCLRFAHDNGYRWSRFAAAYAAAGGQLACLRYAIEDGGCKWGEPIGSFSFPGQPAPVTSICTQAARAGSIECLKYAHQRGCPMDNATPTGAVYGGSMECLQYVYENYGWGTNMYNNACTEAASRGHYALLQYAHSHGCPLECSDGTNTYSSCEKAASNGHLDCLIYAHENGSPLTIRTSHVAASNGHLSCLAYAHENGCPWDMSTAHLAARHSDCWEYVVANGCPHDPNIRSRHLLSTTAASSTFPTFTFPDEEPEPEHKVFMLTDDDVLMVKQAIATCPNLSDGAKEHLIREIYPGMYAHRSDHPGMTMTFRGFNGGKSIHSIEYYTDPVQLMQRGMFKIETEDRSWIEAVGCAVGPFSCMVERLGYYTQIIDTTRVGADTMEASSMRVRIYVDGEGKIIRMPTIG